MKNKAFLIQTPDGQFRFVGLGVPLVLAYELKNPDGGMDLVRAYEWGNSLKPRVFKSAMDAEIAAGEINFINWLHLTGQGPLLVTFYYSTEMYGDIKKAEGKLISFGARKYAQYSNAPFVQFIPKGKRSPRELQKSSYPYLLILAGVGHPEPKGMFGAPIPSAEGVVVREARYASFDERFKAEFDVMVDKYIEDKKPVVLMDARDTKGFNCYERAFGYEVPVS